MEKVKRPSDTECYTPSLEPFLFFPTFLSALFVDFYPFSFLFPTQCEACAVSQQAAVMTTKWKLVFSISLQNKTICCYFFILNVYSNVGPWPLFSFLILYTIGRAPWKGGSVRCKASTCTPDKTNIE
jgi:hypothetical protein